MIKKAEGIKWLSYLHTANCWKDFGQELLATGMYLRKSGYLMKAFNISAIFHLNLKQSYQKTGTVQTF